MKLATKKMEGQFIGLSADNEDLWNEEFGRQVQFFMNEIRGGGVELSIDD
jgi:hypothetical protein